MNVFDEEAFAALPGHAAAFETAEPCRHVVIDGLFKTEVLAQVAAEFYPPDDPRWSRFSSDRESKLAIGNGEDRLPPTVKALVRELNAAPFLWQLSALTGIEGLIPDPYLAGGGMHCISRDGRLEVHADFNVHPVMNVDRRLNLLTYLNRDWLEPYGGQLELWDRAMTACRRRIAPVFNRTVIFATDDFSFHGHPEPLTCPEGWTRKSIALYYYSNGRPAAERRDGEAHDTLFQERPAASPRSRLGSFAGRMRGLST